MNGERLKASKSTSSDTLQQLTRADFYSCLIIVTKVAWCYSQVGVS